MDGKARIQGLDEAMKTLVAAFPMDSKTQKSVLNAAIRKAANPTVVRRAKELALAGDGSGALSAAISARAMSQRKLREKNVSAGIEVVPVRFNPRALALYIQHYFTARGQAVPEGFFRGGLRHGHLVEFGTRNAPARPFMWPALAEQGMAYRAIFTASLRKAIETRVKRARRS